MYRTRENRTRYPSSSLLSAEQLLETVVAVPLTLSLRTQSFFLSLFFPSEGVVRESTPSLSKFQLHTCLSAIVVQEPRLIPRLLPAFDRCFFFFCCCCSPRLARTRHAVDAVML